MKTLKKYAYQSPETEILSLGAVSVILGTSPDPDDDSLPVPGDGDPIFGAPWRY